MKLIIQIPCYNEQDSLKITISHLPKHISGIDEIEYLIIDDGSIDKTVEVAKKLGIHHIVSFKKNKGLARGFMAGIDACLSLGADIIVNTDADNQYCGEDIKKLVEPILDGKADIVIGKRPIDSIDHFSWTKKKLQHFGSWVVRCASNTDIQDASSGFRAYSREAALRLNVYNEYSYTLETIIQAGKSKTVIYQVPIRTNKELRPSRLFTSNKQYVKRSSIIITNSFILYHPLKFFMTIGSVLLIGGLLLGGYYIIQCRNTENLSFLILSVALLIMGFQAIIVGFLSNLVAVNRKLLEDIQVRARKYDYEHK